MRKEVIIAAVAGSLLGLVIAFGIWKANSALKPKEPTPAESPQPSPATGFEISLAKPEDQSIALESPVTFSGITQGNSTLVISAEEKDYFLTNGENGTFEKDIPLIGGVNEIKVFAFDQNGSRAEKSLLVVYSSEFAKSLAEKITPAPQIATEEAVEQKVAQRLAEAQKSPRAYLGTVMDIAKTTIQIKTQAGEIKQIAFDEKATIFVKTGTTNKEVKSTDLAIGDFIIALGLKNGNGVLDTRRILITQPYKPSGRQAVLGEVIEIGKKEVTLKDKDNKQWTAQFGKTWTGPDLDEIEKGKKVIVIGTATNNTLQVRTLKKI